MKSLFLTVLALGAGATLTQPANAQSSTFDTGLEGWSIYGDFTGNALTWVSDGFVQITNALAGQTLQLVAPGTYHGDKSAAIGTDLKFDFWRPLDFPGQRNPQVTLLGAGMALTFDVTASPEIGIWTSYTVPLTASAWRLDLGTGPAPTPAQFQAVMTSLGAIYIRGEDRSGLDNVILNSVPEVSPVAMLLAGLLVIWTATWKSRNDRSAQLVTRR